MEISQSVNINTIRRDIDKILPILILHGWGSKAAAWRETANFLIRDGYKVIIPDLPGFGDNPPPEKPWGTDEYVEWIDNFVRRNNLSRFFLLGHSFGGGLAIKYAILFPEKVEKLFLVAAAFARYKTCKKIFFGLISQIFKIFAFLPFYGLIRRAFYKFIVRKSDYAHAKGVMKEIYLKIIKEDLTPQLIEISAPTAIIWGEKDDITPVKWAYFAKDKIKNSELVIIKDGDHDLERKMPRVLSQKIISFLK